MLDLNAMLSQYVGERETLAARASSPLFIGGENTTGKIGEFSQLVDDYAQRFARSIENDGALNLVQWEALAELANSRLAWMRMRERGTV